MKSLALMLSLAAVLQAIPAFPGAEGWGAATPGGRGGKVLVVTTTASTGAGSFHAALMTTGPRIIVFRVSGVIDIPGSRWSRELYAPFSNVTVAGQTSPGGVTFTSPVSGGVPTSIIWCYERCNNGGRFHDGIFRFMNFRGNANNLDGVTLTYSDRFIFDHCSFSGGQDETLDLTDDSTFTVQWCSISNSAFCSGCQTYAMLIGYEEMTRVSLHHNLMAHHINRGGPHFHFGATTTPIDNGQIQYINNVSYDIGQSGFYVSYGNTVPFRCNVAGNYMKWGPNSRSDVENTMSLDGATNYENDNVAEPQTGAIRPCNTYASKVSTPWNMPPVTTTSSAQALDDVLDWVGPFPRDPMMTRTVQEVRAKGGNYGKTDDAMITTGPAAPADADMDGMPDFWESGMSLNPNDSSDYGLDQDGDGYTNLEEYINDLAQARLCQDYYNPVYPIPSGWADYNPSCSKYSAVESRIGVTSNSLYLSASPNPFKSSVLIRNPGGAVSGLAVHDITGKVLNRLSPAADAGSLTWNANGRPSGIYLLRGLKNEKAVTLKLFLEK